MSYYVYLLLCDDGSYYTGYTSKLASRLHRHKRGQGARYTRMRRPKRIVYVERFGTRRAAMRRERQIKALSHNQKHDLAKKAKRITSKPMRSGYRRRMPFRVT
jgi:putative endonuclease